MKKKNRFKVKYNTMVAFFFAMFAFWSLNPYFTWSTYMGGIFGKIGFFPVRSIWALLSIMASMYYMAKKRKIEMYLPQPALIMIIIVSVMLICCGGINSNPFDTAWLAYIAIFVLLLLPREIHKETVEIFAIIFTIFLIIPIITYILTEILKINIPYSIIQPQESEKINIGVFYKHRLLSVQFSQNALQYSRFNGIYYEAGVIGTICGLLLGVYNYELIGKNTWKQKIWLLCGACSLSLSFILFTTLFFIVKNITESRIKNVVIIFCVILLYFAFISINFSSPALQSIQRRITFDGIKLQGNNRVSQGYNVAFSKLQDDNIFKKMFGYGREAFAKVQKEEKFDGSSYKSIIYDYGYLGFFMYLFWFCNTVYYVSKKYKIRIKEFIPILIMQLANIYQKPDVFAIYYVILFLGGIIYTIEREKKNEVCNKCCNINI